MFKTAIKIELTGPWTFPKLVCNGKTLWIASEKDHLIKSCLIGRPDGIVRFEPKNSVDVREYVKYAYWS